MYSNIHLKPQVVYETFFKLVFHCRQFAGTKVLQHVVRYRAGSVCMAIQLGNKPVSPVSSSSW